MMLDASSATTSRALETAPDQTATLPVSPGMRFSLPTSILTAVWLCAHEAVLLARLVRGRAGDDPHAQLRFIRRLDELGVRLCLVRVVLRGWWKDSIGVGSAAGGEVARETGST